MSKRAVVAGGAGFIGREVVACFESAGWEPVVLTRRDSSTSAQDAVRWDARTLGAWREALEGASALVNLCGSSAITPWTRSNWARIEASRVGTSRLLCEALGSCQHPPACWINASGVHFYGDTGGAAADESHPAGLDPLARLCAAWEGAIFECPVLATRKVAVRIGFVIGRDGGGYPPLFKAARSFFGGAQGSGAQYVSWIHVKDLARLIVWCAEKPVSGPVNGVSPQPVTNRDFMAAIRRAAGRAWGLPVPAIALRAMRAVTRVPVDLALASVRTEPGAALAGGFGFEFPDLGSCLRDVAA